MRLTILAAAIAAVLFVLPAAAKPATSSIALNETNVALGDHVTFTTSYPNNVHNPRVEVLCYQAGELVYGEGGAPTDVFQLGGNPDGGSIWANVGGPADCVANLYYFTHHAGEPGTAYLATTSFAASG